MCSEVYRNTFGKAQIPNIELLVSWVRVGGADSSLKIFA